MEKKRIIPVTLVPAFRVTTTCALALCALLVAATSSFAAHPPASNPNAVVEAVQMPAWVERASGARDALTIGMALVNKDKVRTGAGARALLRLADGSLVRLGENGLLILDDLAQRKVARKDLLTASFNVQAGAFRFTAPASSKFRGERDVQLKVADITVGVPGRDVWSKSDKRWDIVCLIDGTITVTRGQDAFTMDQPLTYYVAPHDAPAPAVAPVSSARLQNWTTETEFIDGAAVARKGGPWKLYLFDFDNQAAALDAYDRLRGAGYPAQIKPVKADAGFNYRVHIANLAGEKEATSLASQLKASMDVGEPKVSR